ncbi:hypothetical protein OUZ56_003522 [Daphnia magna]|uniref:Uncharacterized protein n=1 Tax=Daphnia magna TaxID=35525 RepID=A0ABR0A8Z5_9CRUS|nr:hypothetical protein OUZ56_003522 [Daphnia magna]
MVTGLDQSMPLTHSSPSSQGYRAGAYPVPYIARLKAGDLKEPPPYICIDCHHTNGPQFGPTNVNFQTTELIALDKIGGVLREN